MRERDPLAAAKAALSSAAARRYEQMRDEHVADYQRFAKRSEFRLDATAPDLPTNERLSRVKAGGVDLALESLYFQFGRYLLISSSRPGSLPANLQGKWNESLAPSWDSKYTININTEMNYWPAEVTSLSELHEPLFDLVDKRAKPGPARGEGASTARGGFVHASQHRSSGATPCRSIGVRLGHLADGRRLAVAALLGSLRLHARPRRSCATRAYPVMKEAAEFLLDYMVPDRDGHLVTGPSLSPENRYKLPDGTSARRLTWVRRWTPRSRTRSSAG